MPSALIALVGLPAVFGSLRLVELAGGPQVMPANAWHHRLARTRRHAHRQRGRVRRPRRLPVLGRATAPSTDWHRVAGRVIVFLGLAVAALSALWMTLFCPRHPGNGVLAQLFRLAFGSGMAASIVLDLAAIRHGDLRTRRSPRTMAVVTP